MKNILETKTTLLNNLNLGSILESNEASTVKGLEILNSIKGQFESFSGSVAGLMQVRENVNRFAPVDKGLYTILEKIDESLLANEFEYKLAYCHEVMSVSSNMLSKSCANVLEKLAELEVSEAKNQIRNGALNSFKASFGVLGLLTEASKLKTENVEESVDHIVSTPITYLEEGDQNVSIRLGGQVFCIVENNLIKTNSPSPRFAYLSSIVENLVKYDSSNECFVYEDASQRIEVSKEGIKRILGENVSFYENVSEFSKNMKLVNESINDRKIMATNLQVVDALISLKENMEYVTKADNFIIIEKRNTNEKFAAGFLGDNHFVLTLQSNRMPNIVESHKSVIEALSSLKKKSGYDASAFFKDSIIKETKEIDALNLEYNQRKEIVESIQEKINIINAHIKEARFDKNEERVNALLDSKNLAEALLVEQNNYLDKLFVK